MASIAAVVLFHYLWWNKKRKAVFSHLKPKYTWRYWVFYFSFYISPVKHNNFFPNQFAYQWRKVLVECCDHTAGDRDGLLFFLRLYKAHPLCRRWFNHHPKRATGSTVVHIHTVEIESNRFSIFSPSQNEKYFEGSKMVVGGHYRVYSGHQHQNSSPLKLLLYIKFLVLAFVYVTYIKIYKSTEWSSESFVGLVCICVYNSDGLWCITYIVRAGRGTPSDSSFWLLENTEI